MQLSGNTKHVSQHTFLSAIFYSHGRNFTLIVMMTALQANKYIAVLISAAIATAVAIATTATTGAQLTHERTSR